MESKSINRYNTFCKSLKNLKKADTQIQMRILFWKELFLILILLSILPGK